MKYSYEFQVWPDETWPFEKALFTLFGVLSSRVVLDFTEPEFESFRSSLSHHGLTLREIERVPYREPESIL